MRLLLAPFLFLVLRESPCWQADLIVLASTALTAPPSCAPDKTSWPHSDLMSAAPTHVLRAGDIHESVCLRRCVMGDSPSLRWFRRREKQGRPAPGRFGSPSVIHGPGGSGSSLPCRRSTPGRPVAGRLLLADGSGE